jgi:GNAT superfamily N-acetyltransferase
VELSASDWECGFLLCEECRNVVAVPFDGDFVNARVVLDLNWNPDLRSRAEAFDGGWFAVAQTTQDRAAVRLLEVLARNSDGRFLYGQQGQHNLGVAFDGHGYYGYVMWTHKTIPVLRQIFIVPERQRTGLGSKMVRHWAERYAFPHVERFGVEDPNQKAIGLYLKLGYITVEADGRVGEVLLYRVPSGFS